MTKLRNEKLLIRFGKHLRAIRLEKGLSQEDLANDADIPINQIGRVERGEVNPSLSTIHQIAVALGIDLRRLFEHFKA